MSSKRPCEPLSSLARDLPTTPEDVAALRAARDPQPLSLAAILETLSEFDTSRDHPRWRETSAGWEPFVLP